MISFSGTEERTRHNNTMPNVLSFSSDAERKEILHALLAYPAEVEHPLLLNKQ